MDLLQYSRHITKKKEVPRFLPINAPIQRSISYFLCRLLHLYSKPQKSDRLSWRNRFPEWWMAQIKGREVIKNGLQKISTRSNMQLLFNKAETTFFFFLLGSWRRNADNGQLHVKRLSVLLSHSSKIKMVILSGCRKFKKKKSHTVQVSIPLH